MSDELQEGVVVARIGTQAYAFPITAVREVVQLVEPTAMPNWPEHVLGLIEIRGELIPLLDVAEALGQAKSRIAVTQLVLVVVLEGKTVGVLVDGVDGVRAGTVRRTESFAKGGDELARGILSEEHGSAVLVDPAALVHSLQLP